MEIKTYGAEVLNVKAAEVTEISDNLKKTIEEMNNDWVFQFYLKASSSLSENPAR